MIEDFFLKSSFELALMWVAMNLSLIRLIAGDRL